MEFRKEKMLKENDEWVLEIGQTDIPLNAIKASVQTIFIVLMIYFTYNIAHADALNTLEYLSQPKIYCQPGGTCTYCIPYVDGSKIKFDCQTMNSTGTSNHTGTTNLNFTMGS